MTGRTTPPQAIDQSATRTTPGHRRLWLWLLVLVSFACGPLTVILIDKFDQPGMHGAARLGRLLILLTALIFVFGSMFGITYLWMGRRRRNAPRTAGQPATPDPDLSDAPTVRTTTYALQRESGQVRMRGSVDQAEQPKPKRHGALDDPDYPSPRKLRRSLGFALDWMIHAGVGIGVAVATAPEPAKDALLHRNWHNLGPIPVLAVAYFSAASFVDRVVVQAFVHTTIGKAVFGLVALRPDTGRHPSFWRLLAIWLMDLYLIIAIPAAFLGPGDIPGPDRPEDYLLTAIRWRDR